MPSLKNRMSNAGRAGTILLTMAATPTTTVWAEGEAGLYDASAPPGSAFVRVINNAPLTLDLSTPEKSKEQTVASFQVGDYLYLPGGKEHVFSLSGEQITQALAKDSATTLVFSSQGVTTLEDIYFTGRKKALVSFYNLTSHPLALKTQDGKHAVVNTLGSLANGNREINEIKIGLAAWGDTGAAATFPPTFLKKGRSYSYVVFEENGVFRPLVIANAISTIE